MAPQLSEDEIDDLIYFARTGETKDLFETVASLAEREKATHAEILIAAKDESNKSTTLHMATGNGHLGGLGRESSDNCALIFHDRPTY
jgi:predicted FMN-binding regulatory protein PaiB